MKSLSKKEFENECEKLQFRGKCAVLLRNNKMQDISKVNLEYKNTELLNLESLKKLVSQDISGVLVNFNISPKFTFENVEKIMCKLFEYIPDDVNLTITAIYDEVKDIECADITVVLSKSTKLRVLFSKIFNIKEGK